MMHPTIHNPSRWPIFLLRWVLFILIVNESMAQSPYFRLIRTPDIFHEAVITCLYLDRQGYILVGTSKGGFRYDGKEFKALPTPGNETAFHVTALFIDKDNRLWIGTRNGKIYRSDGDSIVRFTPQEGSPKKTITGFASDPDRNIWFSTYGEGLYIYNGRYLYNFNSDDGLSDDFCHTMMIDDKGRAWVGTDDGISICEWKDNKKKISTITTKEGLPDNIVLKLHQDLSGKVWVGMQDGGLCSIDTGTGRVDVPKVSGSWAFGPVHDIQAFGNLLWLTNDKQGIIEVDTESESIQGSFSNSQGVNFPKTRLLLKDSQGNCWVATSNELILSAGPGFKRINSIGNQPIGAIHAILADSRGGIWFSQEEKLFRYSHGLRLNRNLVTFRLPINGPTHIISLYEDPAGFIWAGTFGNGLFRIDPVNGKVLTIDEKHGLTNGNILSIDGTSQELWLATLGGAYRCRMNSSGDFRFENYNHQNGPGNNYIYKVFIDSKERIWFGTDGKGLSLYENGRFLNYGPDQGLPSKIVYSITEDALGRIWITTAKEGVYCYDGKKFRNYTVADGLSDLQISSVMADRGYHIFFAYDRGIDVMDIRSGVFSYYGQEYGLEAINPELNVIAGTGNGPVWIGTEEGIVCLDPGEDTLRHPEVRLNRVSVFLGKENLLGEHTFSYSQNHISFFFNSLWYRSPDLVTYEVKLEGYDLDWIHTRDNFVTYSSLPPGDYVFSVRSALKGNFKNSPVIKYSFTVKKPFWKSYWFLFLVMAVTAILIYIFIRARDKRFKQREAAEREKLLFQFQTLRSQVNPHFLFNSFSTLMSVIDEDKDLAIEYVRQLSQFFRNILEYRDKELITLEEEIKLIESYQYIQNQRYGDNFRLNLQIPKSQMLTLIPPLTLQMLVENAIKHNIVSEQHPLSVTISADDKYLYVRNNLQKKKLPEPSTGIGIENIRKRYLLMGKQEIEAKESVNEFIIKLPLIYPLP